MSPFPSFTFHFAHILNSNGSCTSLGIRVFYWSLRTIDAVGEGWPSFPGPGRRRSVLSAPDGSENAGVNLFWFSLLFFFPHILCFPPIVQKHAFKMYIFPAVNAIHPDIFRLDIRTVLSVLNIETIDSETPTVTFLSPSNFLICCCSLKHDL